MSETWKQYECCEQRIDYLENVITNLRDVLKAIGDDGDKGVCDTISCMISDYELDAENTKERYFELQEILKRDGLL